MRTLNKVLIALCITALAISVVCGSIWGAEMEQGPQSYNNVVLGWVAFSAVIVALITGVAGALTDDPPPPNDQGDNRPHFLRVQRPTSRVRKHI
jgi:hypothetical protein